MPIALCALLTHCTSNPHFVEDKTTQAGVNLSMAAQKEIPSRNISTHVDYGVLQVAGFVDNKKQLTELANTLNDFDAHYRVINNVKILPVKDHHQDETHLKKAVKEALSDHHYPVKDIGIQIRNGQVILSGFMNKHVDLVKMSDVIRSLPGVTKVDNYILYRQSYS